MIRGMIATGESDTRKVMELADKNDVELKKSVASVVELLGSSIATLKADTDQNIRDIQTAVQQLHDKTPPTTTQQPPDVRPRLDLRQELEALRTRLHEHQSNAAHSLDPMVLTQRLARGFRHGNQALSSRTSVRRCSGPTRDARGLHKDYRGLSSFECNRLRPLPPTILGASFERI